MELTDKVGTSNF